MRYKNKNPRQVATATVFVSVIVLNEECLFSGILLNEAALFDASFFTGETT